MKRRYKKVHSSLFTVHGGQSLVEVIIAVAVTITLAVSLIAATILTQKASRSARNQSQATKLAQQNSEQVRVFRDRRGFSGLPGTAGCYTLNGTSSQNPATWSFASVVGCPGEAVVLDNVTFTRRITTTNTNTTKKQITVTVTWDEQGVIKNVTTNTFLTDWEGAQ